jgi:hypothetical protein
VLSGRWEGMSIVENKKREKVIELFCDTKKIIHWFI